ncbi:hypothetical protein B0H11DRAFT_1036634 [Mycena galericulata]|nr:hypothetical protein B0H11DRAFT_1036634 [Mycena galericulata]
MPALATYFTILTAVSKLPPLSLSVWAPGKAAQINFYTDNDGCSQYVNEVAAWWTMADLIGGPGSMATQAECISLDMPSNSQSTNTADIWPPNTANTTTVPPNGIGACTFWDELTCSGNEAWSNYSQGHSSCLPARSQNGALWQSAKCLFFESLPQSMSSLQADPTSQISPSSTSNPAPSLPISPSISSSSTSTNPSSSSSLQGSSSFISTSPSAPTQSAVLEIKYEYPSLLCPIFKENVCASGKPSLPVQSWGSQSVLWPPWFCFPQLRFASGEREGSASPSYRRMSTSLRRKDNRDNRCAKSPEQVRQSQS